MPPKGSRTSGAPDEFLNLSSEWKEAKLFSKLPPIEWRTCDVSTKCCNGAWFKVKTDCLLEGTAKIVKRKDGIHGYCKCHTGPQRAQAIRSHGIHGSISLACPSQQAGVL